ncbi:MAG: VCBS repeat-containing protein [Planctomycetes bacterium]|nr:VCBS repeat-containing protein [Planctomycetota bacterium]
MAKNLIGIFVLAAAIFSACTLPSATVYPNPDGPVTLRERPTSRLAASSGTIAKEEAESRDATSVQDGPRIITNTPVGFQTDEVALTYYLTDELRSAVDVRAEFAIEGAFHEASLVYDYPYAHGVEAIASAPFGDNGGVQHKLIWNAKRDLGPGKFEKVKFRIFPRGLRGNGHLVEIDVENTADVDVSVGDVSVGEIQVEVMNDQPAQGEAPAATAGVFKPMPDEAPPAPAASSFEMVSEYKWSNSFPGQIAIADLNKDGHMDILICEQTPQVIPDPDKPGENMYVGILRYVYGTADHKFDIESSWGWIESLPGDPWPLTKAVKVADMNGDDWPDLAVACGHSTKIEVLINNYNFSFLPPSGDPKVRAVQFAVGPNGTMKEKTYPISIDVADVNNDGLPDVLTANMVDDQLRIRDNNSSCFLHYFDPNAEERKPSGYTYAPLNSMTQGFFTTSIVTGDFNKDGFMDTAIGNQGDNGALSIGIGNGSGYFDSKAFFAADANLRANCPQFLEVGDYNGDGNLDIAASGKVGGVFVYLGLGNGEFEAGVHFKTDIAVNSSSAFDSADFNQDGSIDFVEAHSSPEHMSVFYNHGNTGYISSPKTFTDSADRFMGNSIAAGDLNGDGKPDIVVAMLKQITEEETEGLLRIYIQE